MRSRIALALGSIALPFVVAAQSDAAQPSSRGAPPGLAPAVARADEAVRDLQGELVKRLTQAMGAGGPRAAIAVCRDEAPKLTTEVAARNGIRLGRTSDRLRNPQNAPPVWAIPALAAAAGKPMSEVAPTMVDLGNTIGVLRPIAIRATCTSCHGPPGKLASEVREALDRLYPSDRAIGYATGDFRGFFWAEVPKR